MSERVYDVAIFLLILNIALPVFTYAMTDIQMNQAGYGAETKFLDYEELISEGIIITIDERHELVYKNVIEFVNLTNILRVDWITARGGSFRFYSANFWQWVYPNWRSVWVSNIFFNADPGVGSPTLWPTNGTLIAYWNVDHNYTRVSQKEMGLELFFTCEKYDNDIMLALDSGELNVTAGQLLEDEELNLGSFIDFYRGMIIGDQDYGLPPAIGWIFKIEMVLFFLSLVVIARDLLPIP